MLTKHLLVPGFALVLLAMAGCATMPAPVSDLPQQPIDAPPPLPPLDTQPIDAPPPPPPTN